MKSHNRLSVLTKEGELLFDSDARKHLLKKFITRFSFRRDFTSVAIYPEAIFYISYLAMKLADPLKTEITRRFSELTSKGVTLKAIISLVWSIFTYFFSGVVWLFVLFLTLNTLEIVVSALVDRPFSRSKPFRRFLGNITYVTVCAIIYAILREAASINPKFDTAVEMININYFALAWFSLTSGGSILNKLRKIGIRGPAFITDFIEIGKKNLLEWHEMQAKKLKDSIKRAEDDSEE